MSALFGSYWAYFVVPTMIGCAVLLVVLALKPPRRVALLALGFVAVCSLIGVGMMFDAKADAARAAVWMKCYETAPGDAVAKQKKCGGPIAFIGNEMHGNNN
jgi:hypothetical protein